MVAGVAPRAAPAFSPGLFFSPFLRDNRAAMANGPDRDGSRDENGLDDFSERLEKARAAREETGPPRSGAAWGKAMRASTDLLAGFLVGGLIGYGLDYWLETSPWLLLVGLGLGFAAGLRNVARGLKNDA